MSYSYKRAILITDKECTQRGATPGGIHVAVAGEPTDPFATAADIGQLHRKFAVRCNLKKLVGLLHQARARCVAQVGRSSIGVCA